MKKNINNYLQIYFFSFFLCMPLNYGMEITKFAPDKQVDKDLLVALETLHNQNYQENNWYKVLGCLQAGANVNINIDENKKNLLMLAVDKPNGDVIFNYLLNNGAAVNARDKYGNTALHVALDKLNFGTGNIQICKSLLEHKADPNIKIDWGVVSQTPLFKVTQRQDTNTSELIKLLIKYGANFTNQETILMGWSKYYNCTALASAIIHNNTPAIKELCQQNKVPNKILLTNLDEYGNTAFHVITDSTKHREHNNMEKNIKEIMTYSYFDLPKSNQTTPDQRGEKELLKEKFILILYSFNKARLDKDTQLHILANLPELFTAHKKLQNALINRYNDVRLFAQVHHHIESLNKILSTTNNNGYTALQIYNGNNQIIKLLLSGKKLKKDYKIFAKEFPAILNSSSTDNNLVHDIYKKYIS